VSQKSSFALLAHKTTDLVEQAIEEKINSLP
jgi:hypothetical protein